MEHDLSHRQEREHEKEQHAHSDFEPRKHLSSLHPAWYALVGVIFIGAAVLVWICLVW